MPICFTVVILHMKSETLYQDLYYLKQIRVIQKRAKLLSKAANYFFEKLEYVKTRNEIN